MLNMDTCTLPVSRTLLILSALLFVRSQNVIPDGEVIVDNNPVLLRGRQGDLQCRFNERQLQAVYWEKVDYDGVRKQLITWSAALGRPECTGHICFRGHESLYNIDSRYSLIILNVTDEDAGRYRCRVSDRQLTYNYTSVTVKAPPNDPYPVIEGCPAGEPCAIELLNRNATNITCRTEDASVGLVSLSWQNGCPFGEQVTKKWLSPDGLTEKVAVTLWAVPCNTSYRCVAELAATRIDQTTASILVSGPPELQSTITAATTAANLTNVNPVFSGGKIAALILLPLLVLGLLVLALICYLKKGRRTQNDSSVSMQENPCQENIGSEACHPQRRRSQHNGQFGQPQDQDGLTYAHLDLSMDAGHTTEHVPQDKNDVMILYSSILV